MAKKKKYKIKKSIKIFGFLIIVISVIVYFGYQEYQKYLYTKTEEYRIINLGYTNDDYQIFKEKLTNDQIKNIKKYDEFLNNFVRQKYFLNKNLNEYLNHVITEEEDFFAADDPKTIDYANIVSLVNIHGYEEDYEGNYTTDFDKGVAIISNKHYKLGEDYEPNDLVSIEWKYRLGTQNDKKQIRSEVYDAYLEMWEDAYSEGIYLLVDSAYRSASKQKEVYKYYEDLKGTKYADSIAARPGYSEHQTGLALDIYSKECQSGSKFKESNTYEWLIKNSYKYGFILRYPENKEEITGYNYESWHYRYVGKELAKKINDEGITFDEYYAFYIEGNN